MAAEKNDFHRGESMEEANDECSTKNVVFRENNLIEGEF